ncbi:MAG: HNH endonuclease, partial [Nocardioidaceae bacterium]|nr:HNH endonuclease [Nocardioidaceae bacterium]
RRAVEVRDIGCAFPGCTRPADWTNVHHIVHWVDGGPTTLDNGVLLCGTHHRTIHRGDWHVQLGTHRKPEFLPPPWIDPDRTPLRNTRPPEAVNAVPATAWPNGVATESSTISVGWTAVQMSPSRLCRQPGGGQSARCLLAGSCRATNCRTRLQG